MSVVSGLNRAELIKLVAKLIEQGSLTSFTVRTRADGRFDLHVEVRS